MILLAALLAGLPSSAAAAPVLELGPGGRVHAREDPFLTAPGQPLAPVPFLTAPGQALAPVPAPPIAGYVPRGKAPAPTVTGTLGRLRRTGAITSSAYQGDMASVRPAVAAAKRLHGTRKAELTAVIDNLREIAAAGGFTARGCRRCS
jgi:hypothetical protein